MISPYQECIHQDIQCELSAGGCMKRTISSGTANRITTSCFVFSSEEAMIKPQKVYGFGSKAEAKVKKVIYESLDNGSTL
jgi:hypothetical protein